MSRDKIIVAGIVLLGVLGFMAYQRSKEDAAIGKPKPVAELPSIAVTDEVDKIEIKNGNKPWISLEKQGDTWSLSKPVKAKANQNFVKDIVGNLKDLKVEREAGLSTFDDAVKKDKKLDDEGAVQVVAYKGEEKKATLRFGTNNLVLTDKFDKPYVAKGYSSYLYTREPKDWRDKEIWKFDDGNVTSVSLVTKTYELSLTKGDKGWAGTTKVKEKDKEVTKPLERLDDNKVKDLLRDFKGLMADDFGDGKPPSETGFDAPDAIFTFSLKDNAGKHSIKLGKVSGNGRFALKDGDTTIFVVSKIASDWATAEVSKFQLAADAGAGDAGSDASTPAKDGGKK